MHSHTNTHTVFLTRALSHMEGAVEQGVTDVWRRGARKWEKATKDKEISLLPSVCVWGWAFFFSLFRYVSLRRGRTWTLLRVNIPAGVHRTIHTHTLTHTHTHSPLQLLQPEWVLKEKQSKEAGVRERGGEISGVTTCCSWFSVWIEDDIPSAYSAAVGPCLRWAPAFLSLFYPFTGQ